MRYLTRGRLSQLLVRKNAKHSFDRLYSSACKQCLGTGKDIVGAGPRPLHGKGSITQAYQLNSAHGQANCVVDQLVIQAWRRAANVTGHCHVAVTRSCLGDTNICTDVRRITAYDHKAKHESISSA
jgi:hypothetical protein